MWIMAPLGPVGAVIIGGVLGLALLCFFFGNVFQAIAGDKGRIDARIGALQGLLADGPFTNSFYVDGIDAKVFVCSRSNGLGAAVTPEALHVSPLFYVHRNAADQPIPISLSTVDGHLRLETSYLSRHISNADRVYFHASPKLLAAICADPSAVTIDGKQVFKDTDECQKAAQVAEYLVKKIDVIRKAL